MILYYIISKTRLIVDDKFIFDDDIIKSGMINAKLSEHQIESLNSIFLCWSLEYNLNTDDKIIDNLIKGKYK